MRQYGGRVISLCLAPPGAAAQPPARAHRDGPTVERARWAGPLAYSPELKRFVVLGGRTSWADYKQPRPYDVLTLDEKEGRWENAFPAGKDWGPRFGPCRAPAWKDEHWHFRDAD